MPGSTTAVSYQKKKKKSNNDKRESSTTASTLLSKKKIKRCTGFYKNIKRPVKLYCVKVCSCKARTLLSK